MFVNKKILGLAFTLTIVFSLLLVGCGQANNAAEDTDNTVENSEPVENSAPGTTLP